MAASSKIGANESCPCGSGRKYKQCCGSPQKLASDLRRKNLLTVVVAVIAVIGVGALAKMQMGEGEAASDASAPTAPAPVIPGQPLAVPGQPPAVPGSQQPPGPAPPGKIWSVEHGHWHDIPAGQPGSVQPVGAQPVGAQPADGAPYPQPDGPVPDGKVWSPEHGHWHDVQGAPQPAAPGQLSLPLQPPPVPLAP